MVETKDKMESLGFEECDPEIGLHGSLEAAKKYRELLPEIESEVNAKQRKVQDELDRNRNITYGSGS